VNLDARDGQIPPDPGSQRLHRAPAPTYAEGAVAGHFVRGADLMTLWGEPRCGRALARLPDGTWIGWRRGRFHGPDGRDVTYRVIADGAP
jgi:hypothetical protein